MAEAPYDWQGRVQRATSLAELDALWAEARSGGYGTAARYLLVKRNQATIRVLEKTLVATAEKALAPLGGLTQTGAATLLRGTVPGLVETFGNANAQAAIEYYNTQRDLAIQALRGRSVGYTPQQVSRNTRRRATARATAQFKSYVAKQPVIDSSKTVNSIINYGMQSFMQQGGAMARANISNAMTRATAAYNRDTILYNSALDPEVVGVQRVAEADACAFCAMVAFDQYGSARVSGYAADYHNNCRCSIETLYAGDKPYRPEYYDDFPYAPADPSLEDFAAARDSYDLA